MMLVKTEKRQSEIHGIGLFAAQRIPEGTPTWRFTAGIDQAIHPDVVGRLPEASRFTFLTYAYLDIRTGLYVLCADDARFMNHSEELLCDYRTFDRIDREALTFDNDA